MSQSDLEQVTQYITTQEEHDRKMNFQDELCALLREHEIEWDEKYVWELGADSHLEFSPARLTAEPFALHRGQQIT